MLDCYVKEISFIANCGLYNGLQASEKRKFKGHNAQTRPRAKQREACHSTQNRVEKRP